MKTFVANPKEIERKWSVIDADGQVLGRLASEVAKRLRGKHKAIYTPFIDTGDYIIIVNADKVRLTGRKLDNKVYYWHTGFPGGLKSKPVRKELEGRFPERVLQHAIKGMLPNTPLGREMYRKLKIYKGSEHPHAAQQPEPLTLDI
ncbi:MAG: 50S ribosomal protein L13 [Magnetococcales bacterium]|nr:50S ribosomal protein L13 [Magnetococcales bacterium]